MDVLPGEFRVAAALLRRQFPKRPLQMYFDFLFSTFFDFILNHFGDFGGGVGLLEVINLFLSMTF